MPPPGPTIPPQVQAEAGSIVPNGIVKHHEEGVQPEEIPEPEDCCDVIAPFLDERSHSTIETCPSESEAQMDGKRYFICD